ncbi:hypothetical protein J4450_07140 [Candidatus Micrarchaeota archaeon]|nr:hypothetical protein [Candidatus Micrarchaeota archaeon]
MRFYILFILLSTLVFAAGGGGGGGGGSGSGSSGTTSSAKYTSAFSVEYKCPEGELVATVSGVTATDGKLDDFLVTAYKEGISVTSAKTDSSGNVKLSIKDEGRYLVQSKKDEYFENNKLLDIESCVAKEQEFYCTEGKTMKERVKCVLNLPDDYVNKVKYVPEECNVASSEQEKKECIESYKVSQSCRGEKSTDAEREACIRPKLNLGQSIKADIEKCRKEFGSKKRICLVSLKENVLRLVKFRLYNLIYKAYELWEEKLVSEGETVDFTTLVNEKKIAFNNAQTITDKKKIVEDVKAEWDKFRYKAKNKLEEG